VETGINAQKSGASIIKIVMFDEVNEGTAILKAAPSRADAPAQGYWLTLDADGDMLPNDWYLRCWRNRPNVSRRSASFGYAPDTPGTSVAMRPLRGET
jgi:hypothetical protein